MHERVALLRVNVDFILFLLLSRTDLKFLLISKVLNNQATLDLKDPTVSLL